MAGNSQTNPEGSQKPQQLEGNPSRKQRPEAQPKTSFNPFIKNVTFPDAHALFGFCPTSLNENKDRCVFVLDTNTLLLPYTVGTHSLKEIGRVYESLATKNRLVVPGQVAREFATLRANKLLELIKHLNDYKSDIAKEREAPRYPLLEALEEYNDFKKLHAEHIQLRRKVVETVDRIVRKIRNWNMDDPISTLYRNLFTPTVVVEPEHDEQKTIAEMEHRFTHSLPPGYSDRSKPDGGIGDLLIWFTILQVGKGKRPVAFVSQDEKIDWIYKVGENRLYPRQELLDEFRRESGGETFYHIRLGDLLELFGASKSIVKEVRDKENTRSRLAGGAISGTHAEIELHDMRQRLAKLEHHITAIIRHTDFLLKVFDQEQRTSLDSIKLILRKARLASQTIARHEWVVRRALNSMSAHPVDAALLNEAKKSLYDVMANSNQIVLWCTEGEPDYKLVREAILRIHTNKSIFEKFNDVLSLVIGKLGASLNEF